MCASIELDSIIEECARMGKVDESVKDAYREMFSAKKAIILEFASAMKEHIDEKCYDIPYIGTLPRKDSKHLPQAVKEKMASSDKVSLEFIGNFLKILDSSCGNITYP